MTAVDSSPVRRLPRWGAVGAGLVVAALGVVLVLRPFRSLSMLVVLVSVGLILTGLATLAHERAGERAATFGIAGAWIVAGVAVLAWPGITVRVLAVVAGIALVVAGAFDVVAGGRGTAHDRIGTMLTGVASVIWGVLALTWPDVTVLVVAVVFGSRLVLVGLRSAWRAFRGPDGGHGPARDRPVGRLRRAGNLAVSALSLVLALALAGVSWWINADEPVLDAFYDTPDDVPAEPGVLLRSEPFTRAIPDGARAWRILYTTTGADGVPVVASGIVVVPDAPDPETDAPAGEATAATADDAAPVIAWAHGTTGVARRCAPSALADPWTSGALFALDRVVDEGWALVAPDYPGLGAEGAHPYLVGEPAGRSVLDAVRAAHQLDGADLTEETVVWGHSQGGGAALWTGVLAPSYAPDVDIVGVAALAPASDLIGLMDNVGDVPIGSMFAVYALQGYANAYDDVRVADYVRPVGRTTFDRAAARCLDASAIVSAVSAVTIGMDIFVDDLTAGPLAARLDQNVPRAAIEAPLLIAQGESDGLVTPGVQAAYVAARCAAGHDVDYRTYRGLGHVPLVEADSPLIPELVEWTHDRLAGVEPTSTCPG